MKQYQIDYELQTRGEVLELRYNGLVTPHRMPLQAWLDLPYMASSGNLDPPEAALTVMFIYCTPKLIDTRSSAINLGKIILSVQDVHWKQIVTRLDLPSELLGVIPEASNRVLRYSSRTHGGNICRVCMTVFRIIPRLVVVDIDDRLLL